MIHSLRNDINHFKTAQCTKTTTL